MKLFIGNPCGFGNCLGVNCEKCRYWSPCIYFGKRAKQLNLPKWPWLVNMLYKISGWSYRVKRGDGTF